jgi:hypothetical protein
MRKNDREQLSPGDLFRELRTGTEQLGQLAVALGLPVPAGSGQLERLSKQEIIDLWTASRASVDHLDKAWDDTAAHMVDQYLDTVSNSPEASVPSS